MNPLLILWLVYTCCVFLVIFAYRAWTKNVFFATWFPIILLFPASVLTYFIGLGYGGPFFGGSLTMFGMMFGPVLLYLFFYIFRGPSPVDRLPTPHEALDVVVLFGEFVMFLFFTSGRGWRSMYEVFMATRGQATLTATKIAVGLFFLAVIVDIAFMFMGIRPLMTEEQVRKKDDPLLGYRYRLKHRLMTALVLSILAALAARIFLSW